MPNESERLRILLAPLRKREERRARDVALRAAKRGLDAPDAEALRVLASEFVFEKPRRGGLPVRLVDVVITDAAARRNLSVLVDRNGKVVRVEVLDYQPAFQLDEIDAARAMAERDPRARRARRLSPVPEAPTRLRPARQRPLSPARQADHGAAAPASTSRGFRSGRLPGAAGCARRPRRSGTGKHERRRLKESR
jgi:hypothetical protein